MRAKWNQRSGISRLTAVLLLTCLLVGLLAVGAQAQTTQPSRQASLKPLTTLTINSVQLYGNCYVSVRWSKVYAYMSVWVSGTTGVGYLNIYRRFASGNLLVSHKTASIQSHSLSISSSVALASGGRYFSTWGINSASGNSSGGMSCPVLS
jgi:hypothetical protein